MARASRLARRSGRAGVSGVRLTNKGEIALDQIVTFGRPVFCGNATLAAQPLPHQARLDVAPAAGRKSNDNAHRTRWIYLRPRIARERRKGGSACYKVQKSTSRKFQRPSPE